MATLSHLHSNPYTHVCLVPMCNSDAMTASGPTPLRFPVWLGIPKPMIPYPLLGQGVVRTVGSHLCRTPNVKEVGSRGSNWRDWGSGKSPLLGLLSGWAQRD